MANTKKVKWGSGIRRTWRRASVLHNPFHVHIYSYYPDEKNGNLGWKRCHCGKATRCNNIEASKQAQGDRILNLVKHKLI